MATPHHSLQEKKPGFFHSLQEKKSEGFFPVKWWFAAGLKGWEDCPAQSHMLCVCKIIPPLPCLPAPFVNFITLSCIRKGLAKL